jgi:flagellar capping protein FliD
MTQATDTDIRELRDLLLGLDKKIDGLDKRLEVSQARTDERFNSIQQQITDLDKSLNKRIDSLEQRGNAQETRFWGMVTLLATALLGTLGKVIFFPIDKV